MCGILDYNFDHFGQIMVRIIFFRQFAGQIIIFNKNQGQDPRPSPFSQENQMARALCVCVFPCGRCLWILFFGFPVKILISEEFY